MRCTNTRKWAVMSGNERKWAARTSNAEFHVDNLYRENKFALEFWSYRKKPELVMVLPYLCVVSFFHLPPIHRPSFLEKHRAISELVTMVTVKTATTIPWQSVDWFNVVRYSLCLRNWKIGNNCRFLSNYITVYCANLNWSNNQSS